MVCNPQTIDDIREINCCNHELEGLKDQHLSLGIWEWTRKAIMNMQVDKKNRQIENFILKDGD